MAGLANIFHGMGWCEWNTCNTVETRSWTCAGFLSVLSRMVLVGLMLAGLRALPCTAYQTVAWTAYIPHL